MAGRGLIATIPDDESDIRLLKGLADAGRLAIVRRLSHEGEVAACDLATCCDIAQPTLSHHLRVLRETGWVRSVRRGTRRFYSLEPEAVARLGRVQREIGRAGRHHRLHLEAEGGHGSLAGAGPATRP